MIALKSVLLCAYCRVGSQREIVSAHFWGPVLRNASPPELTNLFDDL